MAERGASTQAKGRAFRLLLFVSGATPRSMRAVATVRKLCEA